VRVLLSKVSWPGKESSMLEKTVGSDPGKLREMGLKAGDDSTGGGEKGKTQEGWRPESPGGGKERDAD
jgi:hypothetical protein